LTLLGRHRFLKRLTLLTNKAVHGTPIYQNYLIISVKGKTVHTFEGKIFSDITYALVTPQE